MSEIKTFNAQIESRLTNLDNKDRIRKQLLDIFSLWSSTGKFNPQGIVPLLISLLGIGALTDNVRKRIDIKKLTNAGNST